MATSVTFGLIPLFTLPLMGTGVESDASMIAHLATATVALGLMMVAKKEGFGLPWRDVPIVVVLAALYMGSAQFLLYGYEVMGAGVATTLHFTYPVFVTLLMLVLFRERASWVTWMAVVLAICGVARLSLNGAELRLPLMGVAVILLSAVAYASYIIMVNKSRVRDVHSRKLAFYVFLFTTVMFAVKNAAGDGVQPLPDAWAAVNVVMLAVAPTVISNITLLLAVRNIGGTLTSILGALEPVTAVCIGALVFGEAFTFGEAVGIALILVAVVLVILNRSIKENAAVLLKRIRPRHS